MKLLPAALLKAIVRGLDERIKILQDIPAEFAYLFRIENINVLRKWLVLFPEISNLLLVDQHKIFVSDRQLAIICFYADLLAGFLTYNGTVEDLPFIESVNYFFDNHKDLVGERNSERLFWDVFPKPASQK